MRSSFVFTGTGQFSRDANDLIIGAGSYNVTGAGGAYAGRAGKMTALNHGREADHSFEVHLVVQWNP